MKHVATVRVTDHNLGISDHGGLPIETADYSTGLLVTMSVGALIYTGIDTGYVHVSVELRTEPPTRVDADEWDDVVEASINAPHGKLRMHQMEYGPGDSPPALPILSHLGPGIYRIRVHVRGRDRYYDRVENNSDEFYHVLVWPADPVPSLIIRATDQCGYGLRLTSLRAHSAGSSS